MKKISKKMARLLIMAIVIVALSKDICITKAESSENVNEQGGFLINICPVFHHERYVNGYFIYNINIYQNEDMTYILAMAKNITNEKREESKFKWSLFDKVGNEKAKIDGVISALEPGKSVQIQTTIYGEGFPIDFYDFVMEFSEEYLQEPDRKITINKEITCDKSELEKNDAIILKSEEMDENVTYQWFFATEISATGTLIEGATERAYRINNVSEEDINKYYYCRIWKEDRAVNSKWERLKAFVLSSDTSVPTEKPVEATPTTVPPVETIAPTVQPDDTNLIVNNSAKEVSGLVIKQTSNCMVNLAWNRSKAENIIILRAEKKKSQYELIEVIDGKKKKYVDKTVKRGRTYYYKVISYDGSLTEDALNCKASVKQVALNYLIQPVATIKKDNLNGQKFVQIQLKKYEGTNVEIYMRDIGQYKKLNINKGMNLTKKRKYRFRYEKGGVSLFFRVRTFQKINGKRRYSKFSDILKIRL